MPESPVWMYPMKVVSSTCDFPTAHNARLGVTVRALLSSTFIAYLVGGCMQPLLVPKMLTCDLKPVFFFSTGSNLRLQDFAFGAVPLPMTKHTATLIKTEMDVRLPFQANTTFPNLASAALD